MFKTITTISLLVFASVAAQADDNPFKGPYIAAGATTGGVPTLQVGYRAGRSSTLVGMQSTINQDAVAVSATLSHNVTPTILVSVSGGVQVSRPYVLQEYTAYLRVHPYILHRQHANQVTQYEGVFSAGASIALSKHIAANLTARYTPNNTRGLVSLSYSF